MLPGLGKECAADLFLPLATEPTENLKTDATQGLRERETEREREGERGRKYEYKYILMAAWKFSAGLLLYPKEKTMQDNFANVFNFFMLLI